MAIFTVLLCFVQGCGPRMREVGSHRREIPIDLEERLDHVSGGVDAKVTNLRTDVFYVAEPLYVAGASYTEWMRFWENGQAYYSGTVYAAAPFDATMKHVQTEGELGYYKVHNSEVSLVFWSRGLDGWGYRHLSAYISEEGSLRLTHSRFCRGTFVRTNADIDSTFVPVASDVDPGPAFW